MNQSGDVNIVNNKLVNNLCKKANKMRAVDRATPQMNIEKKFVMNFFQCTI